MRQRQRLRVRLRLRLGLALRLKRSVALGLSIDRLGALLRLSLSVATWAPRRVGVLELRAEDLDAPLLTLSPAARVLRRRGALELRIKGALRQYRAGSTPPKVMRRKDTACTRCLASTIVLEIAMNKLAKEGVLYLRTSPPPAMASGEMQFQGAYQELLEDVLEEFDTDLAMLGVSCSEHTGAQGLQSLRCVQVAQGLKTLRAVLDGLTITKGNLMGAICSEHTIATYRAAVTTMLCLILLSAGALGLQSPGGDASDVCNHAI